jgi:branched-chain amino acid transport system substrate-binding protein
MVRFTNDAMSSSPRMSRIVLVLSGVILAATLTACTSTTSSSSTTSPASSATASKSSIPASAFKDYTGITATSVSVGNVSTLFAGLFKGAAVGTKAYAEYINSQGGVNGRKIVVDGGDDNFQGGPNKQLTQAAIQKDFAMVGGFSLQDNFGGTVLAANPQVPNVTVSLDLATSSLPNSFSPVPAVNGWQLGPLVYFQKRYPTQVKHAAALIADQPSAVSKWTAEKAGMASLGYKVVYDPTFDITTSDFNQYVITMKNDGVQILFLEQMPENYASAVIKALHQQNFHPVVVLGGSTYSQQLIPNSGPSIDGSYLDQNTSLYLGDDAASIPAIGTFQTWIEKASPGFSADLYTLFGWLSAELFTQALRSAGANPSRGSVLRALQGITSFSGDNLVGTANPAKKIPSTCYIIARVQHGKFNRLDDPPVSGPTHGYRCDQPYYYYKPA